MTLETDLFAFAYIPSWYMKLDELAELALPEPWCFKSAAYTVKNPYTPILERYLHCVFRKQAIDYNTTHSIEDAEKIFYVRNEVACFHTGLFNKHYRAIYACFSRNKKSDSLLRWYFQCFADEVSPWMKYVQPMPGKPTYSLSEHGVTFNPEWPIRVNIDHILGDQENIERLPEEVRYAKNLPLLLETAVELARRKAAIEPGNVVPQGYQGRVQYLLPICLTNMVDPDLAMTLTIMDGYYLCNTCITLEMAYLNARLLARPQAPWLTALIE